jgi:hypothetical protein
VRVKPKLLERPGLRSNAPMILAMSGGNWVNSKAGVLRQC